MQEQALGSILREESTDLGRGGHIELGEVHVASPVGSPRRMAQEPTVERDLRADGGAAESQEASRGNDECRGHGCHGSCRSCEHRESCHVDQGRKDPGIFLRRSGQLSSFQSEGPGLSTQVFGVSSPSSRKGPDEAFFAFKFS